MKTKYFSFFLVLFLFVFDSNAAVYMGGEITWQCLGNGHFRFVMKLYRECNGNPYSNTKEIAIANYPGLSSISMYLKPGGNPHDIDDGLLDGKTDLSPHCFNPAQEITCTPQPALPNTGAIEEWYYTSDSAYPNGVPLNGVPPATGWIFSHAGVCRNPSTNIPVSCDWFIRAIMYPYNNTNMYPCFDNSPVFAESPVTVICNTYPSLYCAYGTDKDNDLLSYSWAPALNGNSSTPVSYLFPYTYNSPLPGPAQNPLNVAAIMDSNSGDISFTTYTDGAFLIVTKATEFRNGIKIGEVFREFQLVISACGGTNDAPVLPGPFYNPVTGLMEFTDTVNMGDIADFDLTAIDFGTLPNGNPQTVTLDAGGPDFGTGFTDPNSGCPNPPCATLNPPPVISAMMAVATHFHWQTDCSHMTYDVSNNNFINSTHYFYVKIFDNYCPIPGYQYQNIKVVILAPHFKPVVTNVSTYFIQISWSFIPSFYGKYYIYRAINYGPFVLLDSTNTTNYVDVFYSAGQTCQYKIRAKDNGKCDLWSSVCSTADWLGIRSDDYENTISVYPNPANKSISIDGLTHTITAEVYDISGKLLLSKQLNSQQLDISPLAKGLYFIKLSTAEGSVVRKFIKE